MQRCDIEKYAKEFNIDVVSIIGMGNIENVINIVTKGFKSKIGIAEAEGLIIKPFYELFDRMSRRIVIKLKVKDFKEK